MEVSTVSPSVKSLFDLEYFFDLSPDLLCIAGYDGYFKKINPAVSKTLGYTNDELFASPINSFVHPEDRKITSAKRANIKNNNPLLNFENRYVTKTDEIVWLSWTSMPIVDEELVFAIAKVITHKKNFEADRNLLLNNLTRINNELKQLTYTTSHDLRLPVSNLISIFDFLDTSKIQDEETLEYIDMLKLSAEGLKNTLNNYVDVLTEQNILNVEAGELDINECLGVAIRSLGSLIQGSQANISTNFAAFGTIKFNRGYLESIFLNLLTNSIKYAKPGVAPAISIYTVEKNGVKQLVFSDDGVGFDMAKVSHRIFGFNQKFSDHNDSKGIGLYLVHNHITSLGGSIKVESIPNEGATFTMTF